MNESISVVMAAHNAQATLPSQVNELLDVLPELTNDFEILIVDDGSTDHTYEVGIDFAHEYPQVQIIRLGIRSGTAVAVRTGIQRTSGEVILVHDHLGPISSNDVRQLWQLRDDPNLLIARTDGQQSHLNTNTIHRLLEWSDELKNLEKAEVQGGIQMIRRQAIHRMSDLDTAESGINVKRISRTDMAQTTPRKSERQIVSERLERFKKLN